MKKQIALVGILALCAMTLSSSAFGWDRFGWGRAASGNSMSSSVASGDFDFYLLSLSWSPGFCDTNSRASQKSQCDRGSDLGFVVHGLWPQDNHGFPSDCGRQPLPRAALESARGLFPDEGLARYEWNKHGTCSGRDPQSYFSDVRRARDKISIPEALRNPNQDQQSDGMDVQRQFIAANPGLSSGMMSVNCERGELLEVRFCMSKDLRSFVSCPEVARHQCRGPVTIPSVR